MKQHHSHVYMIHISVCHYPSLDKYLCSVSQGSVLHSVVILSGVSQVQV